MASAQPCPNLRGSIFGGEGPIRSTLTRIYFGGDSGVAQDQPKPRLTWQRPAKKESAHRMDPPPAKLEVGNETASARPGGPAAGSLYGSLSYGSFAGPEIRPALPVVSPDPVFGSDAAGIEGDVIVEITIDDGNARALRAKLATVVAKFAQSDGEFSLAAHL